MDIPIISVTAWNELKWHLNIFLNGLTNFFTCILSLFFGEQNGCEKWSRLSNQKILIRRHRGLNVLNHPFNRQKVNKYTLFQLYLSVFRTKYLQKSEMSVLWSHLKRAKLRNKCCLLASLGDTTSHTVAMVFKVVQNKCPKTGVI